MLGFPAIAASESHRVRRWDAVILGGALPGLVAAVQIARSGCRVLLVEEDGGEQVFPGLREPFHLSGPGADHVLGGMLRELGISLIDQRRVIAQREGLQIALPDARIDIGPSATLVDELAAWRLASPDESREVLRSLEEAGARERRALLLAPLVRAGRRRPFSSARIARGLAAIEEEAGRGMPTLLAQSPRALRLICDLLVRALGNHASRAPSSEASARLLGSALEGSYFVSGQGGLRDILMRRLESLGVDRRRVPGDLRFISVANQPGLSPTHTEEIWTGRALVLNAPASALGAATAGELPSALDLRPSTHERVSLHFQTARAFLPESMGDRVIAVTNPADPVGEGLICVRTLLGEGETANILASAVVPRDKDPRPAIEQCVRKLLPFSEQTLQPKSLPELRWDRDSDLEDPTDSAGWPDEVELRLYSRPKVLTLDRRAVASLGFEGDLLLGWRAGQAIAADLQ